VDCVVWYMLIHINPCLQVHFLFVNFFAVCLDEIKMNIISGSPTYLDYFIMFNWTERYTTLQKDHNCKTKYWSTVELYIQTINYITHQDITLWAVAARHQQLASKNTSQQPCHRVDQDDSSTQPTWLHYREHTALSAKRQLSCQIKLQ